MPKRHKISEAQEKEIQEARKNNKDKKADRRLKAILLHAVGKKHEKIAEQTEFSQSYISRLVCKYCAKGLSVIIDNHYPGNHRNMSHSEEEALLAPFKKAAESGQIVETSAIKAAFLSYHIRRLLDKRGWFFN